MRDLMVLVEGSSPYGDETTLYIVGWKDGYQDLERLDRDQDEDERAFYKRTKSRLDDWMKTNRYDGITIMTHDQHVGVFGNQRSLNESIEAAEQAVRDAKEAKDDAYHAYRHPGPLDDQDELFDAYYNACDILDWAEEELKKLTNK